MKTKNYIILSFLSLFTFFGLAILGGFGHSYKFFAASIFYFTLTWIYLSKAKSKREIVLILLFLLLPPIAVYIPIHVLHFKETKLSLPSSLAHFIGIAFGIAVYNSNKISKFILIIILLTGSLWMTFIGYGSWLNDVNFGTFTENVNYRIHTNFKGIDQYHHIINEQDLKGKVILLDFWYTRCGVCFTKFPQFQKLYENYRKNSSILFFAVNKPIPQDSINEAFTVLKNLNYSFPVILPDDSKLPEAFGVISYPTTIVIDTEGRIVFKGNIEDVEIFIKKLIKKGN